MASASTSTAFDPPTKSRYDVFISHRGPDTKNNFASYLYRRLVLHGIRVFWDKEEMQVGDSLTSQIQDAIKTASVHVVIFSPRFAESEWCLNELRLIVESKAPIIPVFFRVQPTELRQTHGEGVYAQALRTLQKKRTRDSQPRYSSITIENWRTALSTVAGMSGLELQKFNEDEGELLENVIDSVSRKMIKPRFEAAEYPIGLDEMINDFENKLLALQRQQTDKPQVIGIVGMGGIGKTTLAKELFNRKSSQYNRSYMLFDVRENARKTSLESLQNKLLKGLTGKNGEIEDVSEGIQLLKSRLLSSQALVILDDVDNVNQLDALLRPIRDVLHPHSLILITSRDRDVLTRSRVEVSSIYKLNGLNPQHSQELFCLHAFTQPHPLPGFEHLVDKFLTACNRLPLSLKVFGGLLYGNHEKPFWEDQLERLEQILPEDIKTRLQVSYDLLQDDEKQIFLDIACFFIGERRDTAIRIWDRSGWKGSLGFRSLQNKSLVEVDSGVDRYDRTEIRIIMHDHLRDLGRDLAKNPTLPRRIWRNEDLDDLLQQQSGVTQVRGISMCWTNWMAPSFSGCIINNLRLLDVQGSIHSCDSQGVIMNEEIMNVLVSSKLIWLRLERHCFFSLPSRIPSMKSTVLEVDNYHSISLIWSALVQEESQISFSGIRSLSDSFRNLANLQNVNMLRCWGLKQLPDGFGNLANLQHIDMSRCSGLKQLPDGFGNLANLQHIHMSGCSGLEQLPDGLGNLANLQHIDMSACSGLNQLPDGFGNLANLHHIDMSGCRGLEQLPDGFGNLANLQHIDMVGCRGLEQLPDGFGNLANLQHIDMSVCRGLEQLPDGFGNLANLQHIDMSGCWGLKQLPDGFGNLANLQHIDMSGCWGLKQLPDGFGNLANLQHIDISHCSELKQLPDGFGNLANLQHIDMSDCSELKQLPDGFGNLANLQHIDMSGCWRLKQLRDGFGNLANLQHIDMSGCWGLKQLPDGFGNLANLQHIDMSQCWGLKQLPDGFGNLANLQHIDMSGCSGLQQLPDTFENLRGLQYFDLSGCNHSTMLSVPSHLQRFCLLTDDEE